jgi:hypothetical protein
MRQIVIEEGEGPQLPIQRITRFNILYETQRSNEQDKQYPLYLGELFQSKKVIPMNFKKYWAKINKLQIS